MCSESFETRRIFPNCNVGCVRCRDQFETIEAAWATVLQWTTGDATVYGKNHAMFGMSILLADQSDVTQLWTSDYDVEPIYIQVICGTIQEVHTAIRNSAHGTTDKFALAGHDSAELARIWYGYREIINGIWNKHRNCLLATLGKASQYLSGCLQLSKYTLPARKALKRQRLGMLH